MHIIVVLCRYIHPKKATHNKAISQPRQIPLNCVGPVPAFYPAFAGLKKFPMLLSTY